MKMTRESKLLLFLTILCAIATITSFLLMGLNFVGLPILLALTAVFFISFIFAMDFVDMGYEPADQEEER